MRTFPALVGLVLVALALPSAPARVSAAAGVESMNLRCAGPDARYSADGIPILENDYTVTPNFRCWGHWGTHTYFPGNASILALHGGFGQVDAIETGSAGQALVVQVKPTFETGVIVERSLDGTNWTFVSKISIPNRPEAIVASVEKLTHVDVPDLPTTTLYDTRPTIHFRLPDSGDLFRFLRFRMPKDPTEGLSGYLDSSDVWVNVTREAPAFGPAPTAPSAEFDCGGAELEAVFDAHPCTFGSTPEYFDAPSYTHTYFLGNVSHVTALSGSALFAPYRSVATAQEGKAIVSFIVQASRDGRADWTTLGTFSAIYGVPAPFALTGLDAQAQFVRVHAEPHVLFADGGTHHFAGFLVSSTLAVAGAVPPHARGESLSSQLAWALADQAIAPS